MSMTITTPASSQSQLSIKSKKSSQLSVQKNDAQSMAQAEPHIQNLDDKINMGQSGDNIDDSPLRNKSEEKPPFEALPLLKQRLGFFWEKKLYTDVVFKVGPDESLIEAHRMILASGSEVFQELLFNNKSLMDQKIVLYEPDFAVPAFEAFVKAFYTNEIPICMTLPMALEVFYATKKFKVGFLQDQVLNHIRAAVSIPNVFEAFRVSTKMMELTFMIPICWSIIEQQTKEVLEHHLDTLDVHTISWVLERDCLNLEEFELFQFLVKWGASMCKQKGMKTTGKNKRQFIEPLLKHIRFTTMSLAQLNDFVKPSRVMEPKEIQAILMHLNKSDSKLSIPYKTTYRLKPIMTPRKSGALSNGNGSSNKLSMALSDSAVVTRKNRSGMNSARRKNNSKFRSNQGSQAQTPRTPRS